MTFCQFVIIPSDVSILRMAVRPEGTGSSLAPTGRAVRGATQAKVRLENNMKFICLGYVDEERWNAMSKVEQESMIEECFAYDIALRRNGHRVDAGEALQSIQTAKTLRSRAGKVLVTDGPFA